MATFADLKKYVIADGWTPVPNRSRGRNRQGDHDRYEKPQSSGPPLRTKVSKHPNEEIGEDLFRRIIRDQLKVDEVTFWEVVKGRPETPPGIDPSSPPSRPGKPGWLVASLIGKAGYTESEIEGMSLDEAREVWVQFQIHGSRRP
jgi:predicted RNA binding protein YcfA (HicA-like mRNA interferase family)